MKRSALFLIKLFWNFLKCADLAVLLKSQRLLLFPPLPGSQQNVDKALNLIGKKFKDLSLTNMYAPPPPPLPLHSLPITSWVRMALVCAPLNKDSFGVRFTNPFNLSHGFLRFNMGRTTPYRLGIFFLLITFIWNFIILLKHNFFVLGVERFTLFSQLPTCYFGAVVVSWMELVNKAMDGMVLWNGAYIEYVADPRNPNIFLFLIDEACRFTCW